MLFAPVLALVAVAGLPAADLSLAITKASVDWEHCTTHGDGRDLGPAPRDALAGLLGLAPPAGEWSTEPIKREQRFFRIAFRDPIRVGTVCTACGSVSLLKADAPFPGDVANDSHWTLLPTGNVRALPANTNVRAIRFGYEHHNQAWEHAARASQFDPVLLLRGRFYNPEPLGLHTHKRLGATVKGGKPIEEWIGFWPNPLPIAGFVVTKPGGQAPEAATLSLEGEAHPRLAKPMDWKTLTLNAGPFVLTATAPPSTRALRVHTAGVTDVMPLVALGENEQAPTSFVPPSPLSLNYTMPLDGFAAVNITDANGKHIRRLIAEVERAKGPIAEAWDLRDNEGRPVPPGTYSFHGIARPPFKLTYEMTAYNPSKPPWAAPVPGSGGWMADHAPPMATCSVGDKLFFAAAGAEFGAGLIATDLNGNKVWQDEPGAQRLVSDRRFAYKVNNDLLTRIDPNAGFAHTPLLKLTYSEKLPAPRKTYITADTSGAAAKPGTLCLSVNGAPEAFVRSAIKSSDIDLKNCVPATLFAAKVHDTALNGQEFVYSTFQLMESSTVASFGPAPTKGPLANTLLLALHREVPVGGIIVPDGDIQVWALRPGKALPAAFKPTGPALDVIANGKKSNNLDLLEDMKTPFDPAIWVKFSTVPGRPGLVVPNEVVNTKTLLFTGPKLRSLDYAMVLDRRYRDPAAKASVIVREGQATLAGGWQVRRGPDRPLSYSDPAIAALVWDKPAKLRGFALLRPMEWAGVAVDAWTGPADAAITADDLEDNDKWEQVYIHRQTRNHIKFSWHTPRFLFADLGGPREVKALRVRIVDPPSGTGSNRPSVGGFERLIALEAMDETMTTADLAQRITVFDLPDAEGKKAAVRGHLPVPAPTALAFDKNGVLHAACEKGIVRIRDLTHFDRVPEMEVVAPAEKGGHPRAMLFDPDGLLFVLDGKAKQINVINPANGQLVRTIGKADGKLGLYDPSTFTEPVAMTLDSTGKLWVVEQTFQPKRISRWSREGQFEGEWLGPTHYGGGGMMDPGDRTVINHLGMKFRLDWQRRTTKLEARLAYYGGGMYLPDRITYVDGRRYLVGDRPVVTPFGDAGPIANICEERNGVAVPLVLAGVLGDWKEFTKNAHLQAAAKGRNPAETGFFWCDANGDGKVTASEVQFLADATNRAPYIGDDLSLNFARNQNGTRLRPVGFGKGGVPQYDIAQAANALNLTREVMVTNRGETLVMGHTFLDRDGTPMWHYPDRYAGVQASYATPWGFTGRPPGVLTGSLGPVGHFEIAGETILCVNSNNGDYYAFTRDGLLVGAILGGPRGYGKRHFSIPDAEPGVTDLSDLRKTVENFHGHVTAANGKVYAIAGKNHITVIRVDGFEQMQRFDGKIEVTAKDLQHTEEWLVAKQRVERFLSREGPKIYEVRFLTKPPVIDGDVLSDWASVPEASVHTTRDIKNKVQGEWKAKLAYDRDNLYITATVTGDHKLRNSAVDPNILFQKGDAFDLQLGLDPSADSNRAEAIPGDLRLLISEVGGKPVAMLYRYRLVNRPAQPLEFKSPVSEITIDEIRPLSNVNIKLLQAGNGWTLEASIPWAELGGKPNGEGFVIRGDLGFTLADPQGVATVSRHYWSNKTNTVLSDLPSEARLHSRQWGELRFEKPSLDALLAP